MNIKRLIIICSLLAIGGSSLHVSAAKWWQFRKKIQERRAEKKENVEGQKGLGFPPTFEDSYIKARGRSMGVRQCGAFNIAPKAGVGNVTLNVQLMEGTKEGFKKILEPGKHTTKSLLLTDAGLRAAYDDAGGGVIARFGKHSHWRIYCYQGRPTATGAIVPQQVNCKDVVDISEIKFPRNCVFARKHLHGALNMFKKAPEIE